MNYGISTWSFLSSDSGEKDLVKIIQIAKDNDFGLELWLDWEIDPEIFQKKNWTNLKTLLKDMKNLTLHSRLLYSSDEKVLFEEIDFCSFLGAELIRFSSPFVWISDRHRRLFSQSRRNRSCLGSPLSFRGICGHTIRKDSP